MRHGQPSVALTGWLRARDLARLAEAYRVAGIVDAPPQASLDAFQRIGIVLCSDLPRSRQSAHALRFSETPVADALFGEARLPYFNQGRGAYGWSCCACYGWPAFPAMANRTGRPNGVPAWPRNA